MPRHPNLLLIMTDQQRADALACAGNAAIRTPNIDRLAGRGALFRHAYASLPLCVPARGLVMSGQWGHHTGVFTNAPGGVSLPKGNATLMNMLSREGYFTQAIGKMHFHPPRNHYGFQRMWLMEEIPKYRQDDEFLMYLEGMGYGHVLEPHGLRSENYLQPQISELPEEHHGTTWVGDRTVEFLEQNRNRPFFCWASFIEPHPAWCVPAGWETLYDPMSLPHPTRRNGEQETTNTFHRSSRYRCFGENVFDDDHVQKVRAYYYANVTLIDKQVGKILDALDALGLSEDTLIIFTSDHGELLGDHYLWQKPNFYETTWSIPLIVSQPGRVRQGVVCSEFASLADLFPTFLSWAGIGMPDGRPLAGYDLTPLLTSDNAAGQECIFGEINAGPMAFYAVRTREWKYIYYRNGGEEELYDLRSDPEEFYNLAGDSAAADIRKKMRRQLIDWLSEEGVQEPLDGGDLRADSYRDLAAEVKASGARMLQPPVWHENLP